MRKLHIIGIGAGNPEHITMQAVKALNQVDVFFFMDKGEAKAELNQLRRAICERYIEKPGYRVIETIDPVRDPRIEDYTERVKQWHTQRVLIHEALIQEELGEDECGAFLVWGDPSLYDSTLRIVDQLVARKNVLFDYEVIPGITSVQALAAAHKIPLNDIGESVVITTGRRLLADFLPGIEKAVVMLDGQCAFDDLAGDGLDIHWGAYLGMSDEQLLSGPLSEVRQTIVDVRLEAQTRKGWIMDTYLLSRRKTV